MMNINRSHQGGQDARIYSLDFQAGHASIWPIFGDLFLARSKLFYRIQVQTWLNDQRMGPLELFNKYVQLNLSIAETLGPQKVS